MFKTKFRTGAILVLVLMFLTVSVMGFTPDLELGGLEPTESVYLGPVETADAESAERAALFSDLVFLEYSAQSIILFCTKNESRNLVNAVEFNGLSRQSAYLMHNSRGLDDNRFICLA